MPSLELLTIPMSHFCEKARWALDRAGLPYRETRHLQIFHYFVALPRARTHLLPVLFTGSGPPILHSTAILRYVDGLTAPEHRLYPADPAAAAEVDALEQRFNDQLAFETRRWTFWLITRALPDDRLIELAAQGAPGWQRRAMALMIGPAKRFLAARIDASEASTRLGEVIIERIFDEVGERLADGRPYLTGDRFTAADLTFASLAAPVLMPRGYGIELPQPETLPPALRAAIERFRATAAGRFALRLFATERGRAATSKAAATSTTGATAPAGAAAAGVDPSLVAASAPPRRVADEVTRAAS